MDQPQVLTNGIAFGESPRWHNGRLWLSDWGVGEVLAVDAGGTTEVMARVESFPLCIDFLPDGRLLLVASADRRLLVRDHDGALHPYAELGGAHPWNDVVVDGRGRAYVNNIGFDFPDGEVAPGSIALVTQDGPVRTVAHGVAFPNGMVVTPDDATLIVAESYGNRLTAFDIANDGGLGDARVWAELGDGVPDGICLDADGAVWYADVPNRCCVRVAEGGAVLQRIDLDRGCFACTLGGPERRTLFLVAQEWGGEPAGSRTGQVLTVDAPAPGAGRP